MSETGRRRWPRVLAAVFSCLVLVSTGLAAAGELAYNRFDRNITSIANNQDGVQTDLGGPVQGEPINILLMGSDTREGADAKGHGHASSIMGARSDTTILLHISGDRTRALGVSIPRDSKVMLPTCTNKQGRVETGKVDRFNEAFDIGGPSCTVKAVEELTGVHVNHFVVVDFVGFKKVVDAIGGVDVCMTKPVNDPESKLKLNAGHTLVKGEQALAFVRARYKLGDGSDIGRIDRQQEFISSAIRKATSLGVISNPITLFNLLDSATQSISADQGLANVDALKDLAINVQQIKPSDVTFTTVPWSQNSDKATISWIPAKANPIWQAIINDTQWPPKPSVGADGKPLTVAPANITVNVLNGTTTVGAATKAAATLRALGYNVQTVGNAPAPVTQTTISNTPAGESATRTLAAAVNTQTIVPVSGKTRVLTLTIGPDYQGAHSLVIATPKAKPPTASSTQGEVSIHAADTATCS